MASPFSRKPPRPAMAVRYRQPRRSFTWTLLLGALSLGGCSLHERQADRVEHYRGDDRSGELRIFLPGGAGPHPAVLLFHGGAWQRGDARAFVGQCQVLVRLGYVCVSAGYRVAERDHTRPEHALDDARAAYRYLIEHASDLHVDPARLIVGGGSSGGHLAVMLATGQQNRHPPLHPAALVLFNPMLDLSPGKPDHEYVAHDWEALSPMHQLRDALPPTLILMGDRDRELPLATAKAFCEKARKLGSECRLDIARGQRHGFFNRGVSRWQFYRTLFEVHSFLGARGLAPK
jgi:acetyl esterase